MNRASTLRLGVSFWAMALCIVVIAPAIVRADPPTTRESARSGNASPRSNGPTAVRAAPRDVVEAGHQESSKSVVFVCDASGSMWQKWDPLRAELCLAINCLQPTQSFDVIFMQENSSVAASPRLLPANPENKRKVIAFMQKVNPRGSSDPIPAIKQAYSLKPELIYLLTDGDFPDNQAVLEKIRTLSAGTKAKVNTIAFMDRGESYEKLLKEIAKETGGLFRFVSEKDVQKNPQK